MTTAPLPDYNLAATAIAPSVLVPWGWHDKTGVSGLICLCYNAYQRTVCYQMAGRKRAMERGASGGHLSFGRHWERVGASYLDYGAQHVRDDWSTWDGADEWLAFRGAAGLNVDTQAVLKCLDGYPHPGPFGSALLGGVVLARKWVGGWSFTQPSFEIVQQLSEQFLMVTRADGLLFSNTLLWDGCNGSLNDRDRLVLGDIAVSIWTELTRGRFKEAGKAGDVYWARYAEALNMQGPSESVYVKARTSGALMGFPVDFGCNTLCLIVPKEDRGRVLAQMDGWRELPFRITPWGARLAGVF
jgi:hypothetical protein